VRRKATGGRGRGGVAIRALSGDRCIFCGERGPEQAIVLGKVLDFAWRKTLLNADVENYCDSLVRLADEALALDSDKQCFADAVRLIRNNKPLGTPNDTDALL
jgi:hypothetical protein